MRVLFCVLLAVLIFPAFSLASPGGVMEITVTGGFKLATTNSSGPHILEALASGGDATIVIISSTDGAGALPNAVRRQWPDGVFGDSEIPLRSGFPRGFNTKSDRVDSVYVDIGTATKVDLTWQNN